MQTLAYYNNIMGTIICQCYANFGSTYYYAIFDYINSICVRRGMSLIICQVYANICLRKLTDTYHANYYSNMCWRKIAYRLMHQY